MSLAEAEHSIPDVNAIRHDYAHGFATDEQDVLDRMLKFTKWLNDWTRRMMAEAYDHGYRDGWQAGWADDDSQYKHPNPYRKKES